MCVIEFLFVLVSFTWTDMRRVVELLGCEQKLRCIPACIRYTLTKKEKKREERKIKKKQNRKKATQKQNNSSENKIEIQIRIGVKRKLELTELRAPSCTAITKRAKTPSNTNQMHGNAKCTGAPNHNL